MIHKKTFQIKNLKSLMIILLICLPLVSALTIDAGSCGTIPIETSNKIFWTASGNSSSIDGVNVSQEGKNITICLDVMFQQDSFTISLIEEQTKEVIREVNIGGGSSGGGSRTIYKDRNVTEYIDKEVIKYLDKENEFIDEPVDVGVEQEYKTRWWVWMFLIIFVCLTIYLIFFRDTDTRRYEDNEIQ